MGKQLISGKKWSPFGLAEGLMKLEIGCRLDQLVSRKGKCGCPLAESIITISGSFLSEMLQEKPDIPFGQASAEASKRFKSLSPEEKSKYISLAAADKARIAEEEMAGLRGANTTADNEDVGNSITTSSQKKAKGHGRRKAYHL